MKKIFLFMFMGAMFASCASKKTLNQTLNDLTASQKSNKEYAEKLDLANKHLASLLRDSTASHKRSIKWRRILSQDQKLCIK